jgi:hypothetical protein
MKSFVFVGDVMHLRCFLRGKGLYCESSRKPQSKVAQAFHETSLMVI